MKYFVYILYSKSKDKYYIGYSKNPKERVLEHNAGSTPSTRPGIPWILVYKEEFEDKSLAIKRELAIKRMKSKIYIEKLIDKFG